MDLMLCTVGLSGGLPLVGVVGGDADTEDAAAKTWSKGGRDASPEGEFGRETSHDTPLHGKQMRQHYRK